MAYHPPQAVFTALNNDGGTSATPMGTLVDAGGLDGAVRSEAAWCENVKDSRTFQRLSNLGSLRLSNLASFAWEFTAAVPFPPHAIDLI